MFRFSKKAVPAHHQQLDTTLIEFSGANWTVRHAVEGVQIFGGIGSGKTSGSGRMLALKYLAAGFGGLVLTVKPDEREEWQKYSRLVGRQNDLIVFSPDNQNFFNFLEYESTATREQKSLSENILQVLKTVIRASEEKSGNNGDSPFWETALDMLMSNVIELALLAYGHVSVQLLYDISQSLMRRDDAASGKSGVPLVYRKVFTAASNNVAREVLKYQTDLSVELRNELRESLDYEDRVRAALPNARRLRMVDQFFTETYFNLNEKTRSIVDFSFSGFLFGLLREPVYSMLCQHASTFSPEDCLKGKIIIIDLPVKMYHKVGRDSQILFKYVWQRAMEKRRVNADSRPVFLWADEAQHFLHEHDAEYQATARSSLIATVYISQNLPNYYANMGGNKYDYKVKSFLGTLGTKIFHANADIETNRYASELIGEAFFEEQSKTATMAGQMSSSKTRSPRLQRIVRPEQFVGLKNGGPLNKYNVEGYLHLQGSLLNQEQNFMKVKFNQDYQPKLNANEKESLFPHIAAP